MRLFLLTSIACATLLFASCKKYDDYKRAFVVNSGDITPSGCGYDLITEDGALLMPTNLPSSFMQDSLRVLVKYNSSGSGICTFHGQNMEMERVDIVDVVRQ